MTEANRYRIADKRLSCKHCGGEVFSHRSGQINTAALTFLNLDWLNASADIYVCARCGFLHWFLGGEHWRESEDADEVALPPEPADIDDRSSATECLSCGAQIAVGENACGACGWSYRK